jgi:multidrug resistance efflux pump
MEKLTHADAGKAVSVLTIKMWLALVTLTLVLGGGAVWMFFGTLHLKEQVSGAMTRTGRVVDIYAREDAFILDFSFKEGALVEADDCIARLEMTDFYGRINVLRDMGREVELRALQEELLNVSQIRSPISGLVESVLVSSGDFVQRGQKLASISEQVNNDKATECLLFVPLNRIQAIRKGQTVNVFPRSVDKTRYGNLTGVVAFISEYPVTFQRLRDVLGNDELAHSVIENGEHYQVEIILRRSMQNPTGYEWTVSNGPSKSFGTLTLCNAEILIDEYRPIEVFWR